jgi:hypothetical protein
MQDVPFNNQRLITDEQFLSHLQLPGAAGKQLAAARKENDLNQIQHIVATHFRTRSAPHWPFYMHGSAWIEINGRGKALDKADHILKGQFRSSWPPFHTEDLNASGGRIDWSKGPSLGASFSRMTFIPELTTAFELTGKTAYLERARDLIRSYVDANPFVLEEGFHEDHDRYFGGGPNNSGDVFGRSLRWLDLMHSGAFQIPGIFSDADLFWLIKQFWFNCMQYYRFVGDEMRRDNHHLTDHGKATFVLGIAFPEFSVSGELVKQGRDTILFHFKNNVFRDGGYAEHCTKYQYHIIYSYLFSHALSRANDVPLFSAAQVERLTKWVEFSARACKPDGYIAEFGDEFGGQLGHLFCTLAAPVMSPQLAAMSRALGYEPGELSVESPAELSRKFKNWQPGTPPRIGLSPWYGDDFARKTISMRDLPKPPSIQYPHGGFSFFRSAWTTEADFMAVSHYTESLPHAHAHWDMMSFVLHTQGQTLIGDPATWIYTSDKVWGPQNTEMRGYMYSPDSHNCLIMNDDTLKPLKALGHGCCWGGYPPKHGLGLFEAGGPIEVGEFYHDAYAPTRHRRFLVHVAGVGFIFVDLLARAGLDLRPHQYSQRYHFEGDVAITPEAPNAAQSLAASHKGARCVIVPGREAESVWKTWTDERLIGIYGIPASITKKGPWVAELTRRIQGPAVMTNFIITLPTARGFTPVATYLGTKPGKSEYQQHEAFSAHTVELGEHGTLFVASCPYERSVDSPELSTDGELAVALLDASGTVKSWVLARGSKFSVRGKKLAAGRTREWQTS